MPRSKSTRAAQGTGTIRKRTVMRKGREYTYWEARVTIGRDPGTGKQIQKTFTGKTQKEVREKMQSVAAEVNDNCYREPTKMTVGEWLDIWKDTYLVNVKPFTVRSYSDHIRNHLKPAFGALRLDALETHTIQKFYNDLGKPKGNKPGLSAKTIKNVHGVLHAALNKAVMLGYIRYNPTAACTLPRVEKKQMHPLDEDGIRDFLQAVQGHRFEEIFRFTLFTGVREGEALGLKWECVDFNSGTILIDKQLQREKVKNGKYRFAPLKNDKFRKISPAPWVMQRLWSHKARQFAQRTEVAELWENSGLVFTNAVGGHIAIHTLYKDFKAVVASIGRPEVRFHDLRHSYAVASIRAGDDIKTVQGNLGHATAAFTLDVYGHVTDQMKQESARRMDNYIKSVLNL
ncbi:MAG: site-specific integrase [Ruminococcaceae bacterium]|nr:site-specific integrase [Oscillospiraceae bacterium]